MQIQGRSDESKVRKRLRKIADLPLRLRIVFFRQQADIVANRQQALEQGGRFGVAVLQRVIVGKPKAARKKYPFSRSQTINAGLGSITKYEPVDRELLLDSRNGAAHAWIVRRQEPTRGINSRLASSSLLPKFCVKVLRLLSNPSSQIVVCMWSRTRRHRSSGAISLKRSASRTVRSRATHAMILDKVK